MEIVLTYSVARLQDQVVPQVRRLHLNGGLTFCTLTGTGRPACTLYIQSAEIAANGINWSDSVGNVVMDRLITMIVQGLMITDHRLRVQAEAAGHASSGLVDVGRAALLPMRRLTSP